jgi:hypothetical protein
VLLLSSRLVALIFPMPVGHRRGTTKSDKDGGSVMAIQIVPAPDGSLRWVPAGREPRGDCLQVVAGNPQKKLSGCQRLSGIRQ